MIQDISAHIYQVLRGFQETDSIILNNAVHRINQDNFMPIPQADNKITAYIDGGQAEILSAGNFCLSFIRIAAVIFHGTKKIESIINEFYLFTKAKWSHDLFYESKIFGPSLIDEQDLQISSKDPSIIDGSQRASISKIANIARRFAELSLAKKLTADFILLDGTLEKTYKNEEKYLAGLSCSALAKSSSLFSASGNSPVILLNKLGSTGNWCYFVNGKTSFVKLHPKAKHVFRFEGDKEILPILTDNSKDALFLGYPYGLVLADRIARVSNEEKNSLIMKFLLKAENKELAGYIRSSNAHDILDNIS